jgi:hypothetical protein
MVLAAAGCSSLPSFFEIKLVDEWRRLKKIKSNEGIRFREWPIKKG